MKRAYDEITADFKKQTPLERRWWRKAAKMGMGIKEYLRKAESIKKELESGHISREFQD